MRNISLYIDEKYNSNKYTLIDNGIYKIDDSYVMSISFIQEPNFGEGQNSKDLSQYPLEDILDRFGVCISDFYESINDGNSVECFLEFSSDSKENIINLSKIIGKHVITQTVKEDDNYFEELRIE